MNEFHITMGGADNESRIIEFFGANMNEKFFRDIKLATEDIEKAGETFVRMRYFSRPAD